MLFDSILESEHDTMKAPNIETSRYRMNISFLKADSQSSGPYKIL